VKQEINQYPNLKRVALEIAYDNGMINRFCTEELFLKSLDPIIGAEGTYHADLVVWDEWLGTLTDEQIQIVAAGEQTEMEELMADAPEPVEAHRDDASLGGLLNDIFEVEIPEEAVLNQSEFFKDVPDV
jgi:hypothetical protein